MPKILYSVFIAASSALSWSGSASRLVGNGVVVVASGSSPIDVSASGVVWPACFAARNWSNFSGVTARSSKFIIEWYVPHSSAQRPT